MSDFDDVGAALNYEFERSALSRIKAENASLRAQRDQYKARLASRRETVLRLEAEIGMAANLLREIAEESAEWIRSQPDAAHAGSIIRLTRRGLVHLTEGN